MIGKFCLSECVGYTTRSWIKTSLGMNMVKFFLEAGQTTSKVYCLPFNLSGTEMCCLHFIST